MQKGRFEQKNKHVVRATMLVLINRPSFSRLMINKKIISFFHRKVVAITLQINNTTFD